MRSKRTAIGDDYSADEGLLIQRAFAGDGDAFAVMMRRYERPVYRMCYRFLPGPDAEDLTQEIFLRAFVNRERFDPGRAVLPWLLVIARNLCIDRTRSRRRERYGSGDVSDIQDHLPSTEESVATTEEIRLLAQGLKALPPSQRETVAMFHFEGLSYREMADVLDVPVGTVMTWLHRARVSLRNLFEKFDSDGIDGRDERRINDANRK